MKRIIFSALALIYSLASFSQDNEATQLAYKDIVANNGLTPGRVAAALNSIIKGKPNYIGAYTATGTNAYVVSVVSSFTAYTKNDVFTINFTSGNSTATTINVNSVGVKDLLKNDGTALSSGDIPANSSWVVVYDGTAMRIATSTAFNNYGATTQIPYMNSGATAFDYTSSLTYNSTRRTLLIGTSNVSTSGTDYLIVGGSNTVTGGGWGVLGGENLTVTGGGGDLGLFGLRNTTNRGSTLTYGTDNENLSAGSFVGGYSAKVTVGTNVPGVSIGIGAAATNKVLAVGGAINISHNSTLGAGLGSNALYSGIFAGTDNYIVSGANNSAIIGGNKMSMPATDTSMVYVPNFRIRSGIGSGTRMVTVDANGYVSNQAIPSGGTESTTASNGLTTVGDDVQLGGALTQDTQVTGSSTYDFYLGTNSNKIQYPYFYSKYGPYINTNDGTYSSEAYIGDAGQTSFYVNGISNSTAAWLMRTQGIGAANFALQQVNATTTGIYDILEMYKGYSTGNNHTNNIGIGLKFGMHSTTGSNSDYGRIAYVATNAVAASMTGQFVIRVPISHVETDVMTIGSSITNLVKQNFVSSTTSGASLNIPNGTAPTSPVNNDVWGASNHLYVKLNGSNYQLDQQSGTGGTVTSVTSTNGSITVTNPTTTVDLAVATNANLTGPITSVGNATSVASQTGTGTTFVMSASPTLTGTVGVPTNSPSSGGAVAASQAYVDNAILGQRAKEAVRYASTAALPSIVYSNGSSGVGATLTGVALAAISLDGNSPSLNDRVIIKDQASTFQNGIYTVTQTGSGVAVFILTRATDFDQASDIQTGDIVFITAGNTLSATTWTYNGIDNPVIGTDAITFVQTAGQGSFTGGNGITITGTSIAIDPSITVDKTTGQTLTNKTLTTPVINGTITGTTVIPVVNGGTGDASLTAYAPLFGGTTSTGAVQSGTVGTAGQVLKSNGAGALPTFQAPFNTVVTLGSDAVNNNATPDTMQDITGLSFPVAANSTYYFKFVITFDAAATGTGSGWSINTGATLTQTGFSVTHGSNGSATNTRWQNTLDGHLISSTSVFTTSNIVFIEGFITCSTSGTVIARFSSEVASSAITCKANKSILTYYQVN